MILTVPTGTPQSVTANATNSSTLSIWWSPPVPGQRNGVIQRYIINITELETGIVEQFYTTEGNIVIGGRHPYYRYSCIVATETIGLGPFSTETIIQMPEAGKNRNRFRLCWALVHLRQFETLNCAPNVLLAFAMSCTIIICIDPTLAIV